MSKTSLMNAQTDSAPAISTHCSPAEICISNIVMSCQVYLHFHLIGEQKFGLHDDSSKKMASLSVKRSRMQFANIPSSSPYQWKPSLPDSEPSNASTTFDVECKFQHLECSVHKMGMVLDSVQNDVIRLNRAMKDATLDSNSIKKKAVVLERSLQEICKGEDDLKELVENCTKTNPDQLNVMNSHSSNLDEISLTLSAWPKQIQADLRLLQSDISSVLTGEMQGIVRAIRSSESRPAATEMPDQSCTINKRPLVNPMPKVNEKPLPNQTTEVDRRSLPSYTFSLSCNGRKVEYGRRTRKGTGLYDHQLR
ncbi:protein PAIR1-like isoform X9 [Panicum virgatum]|uniref:protein PAIR1-like isoform X9 n=1 Tax=Panicum virgatum TaxID=38727 RepID=UPI0019D57463|nr:protein PAIR1-like isoform X9 [Panicum virgatum]